MAVEIEIDTKKVVRVRIEFADGTFSELDDAEECKKWQQATAQQALDAFVHGHKMPDLTWKSGKWRSVKFCVLHPSDRILIDATPRGLTWMWASIPNGDEVVLFEKPEEARARIEEKAREFPNGDWPDCVVGVYTQGPPGSRPSWEPYIGYVCSGCTHFHMKRYCGHEGSDGSTCSCDDFKE